MKPSKKATMAEIGRKLDAILCLPADERTETYRAMAARIEARAAAGDLYGYTPCPQCGMDSMDGALCGWCDGSAE